MSQQIPALPLDDRAIIRKEHLRLLSIAYYIVGAMCILSVSVLLLHLVMLIAFALIPETAWKTNQSVALPPRLFFVALAGVIGFFIIAGWALGGLTVFAGRCIRDRKRFIFVLAMAAINCAFLPYGTLLGVLTFILLNKVETRHEFQQTSA